MKNLFYASVIGFVLFEIANVYFIMPMPGSQQINSLDLAYRLYSWRWISRGLFLVGILVSFRWAWIASRIYTLLALLVVGGIVYLINFIMAADAMFLQPNTVTMAPASTNLVPTDRLVLGVTWQNQARAYPIQYVGYHHQVLDSINKKAIMVTYCTVCRSGRVFEPTVNGKPEKFRLVGMDHFNAMFEDKTTGSWWRQATGEAIAGQLKGHKLPEVNSAQVSLSEWLKLYPQSLILQPDKTFAAEYDSLSNYETGKRKGNLTRRDTLSWQPKSWVVGVTLGQASKAYDWNTLVKERLIHDELNQKPIIIILADDNVSFTALQRTDKNQIFTLRNNTLQDDLNQYNFFGTALNPVVAPLLRLKAYQEYWHSWQSFHPETQKYEVE